MDHQTARHAAGTRARLTALHGLEDWLERPMIVLSVIWVLLVLVELIWGESHMLEIFGTAIWIVFIAEFVLRLTLAPDKLAFVRSNWLTALALIVPAFRMFRVVHLLRLTRASRGIRLVRVVGTANRGVNALRSSLGRRGVGYVMAITLLVTLLGAAGMLAFEPASEVEGGFTSYGDALWWTAMLLTSIGSEFWPRTPEGRVLCVLLSIYGFAVFGYITASLATFFVGREAQSRSGDVAGPGDLRAIRREIAALRLALENAGDEQRRG